ncbi:hypothetical protein U1Q18_005427 [Sarracenia purpurea var. burkii]
MNLRGDDPAAMKQFVLSVQNKANELVEGLYWKWTQMMLPSLPPNVEGFPQPALCATITPFCFVMKNEEKLRVEDILIRGLKWSRLLDPGKKGQWWLPGDVVSITSNVEEVVRATDKESLESQKLLQLAGAQRMNTDVRRAIFCVIMSGEDYIDAFEKLLRLNLQGKQQSPSPFILLVYRIERSLLYLGSLQGAGVNATAEIKELIKICFRYDSLSTLSLAILKCVDFSGMVPKRIIHFKMLFEAIFEQTDKLVWNIFFGPEYESLRNSIVFFINKHVMVSGEKSLANKIKIAKKALANVE